MTTPPAVTFWGAAQTVTGSMHLVEAGGQKILLDCGLPRAAHRAAREPRIPVRSPRNRGGGAEPRHIDHCGNLPRLVREGFTGPIHCTHATRDLIALTLADSARIQEEDGRADRNVRATDNREALSPQDHVRQTLAQCVPLSYAESRPIAGDATLHFVEAGHILGSAMVALAFATPAGERKLTFTGDLGRNGVPLLRDPRQFPSRTCSSVRAPMAAGRMTPSLPRSRRSPR